MMAVPLNWYLILSAVVFSIGIFGFLTRKNIIIMFLSIELMLNGVNISLIAFSHYLQDLRGQVFVFFIIAVAAAEAAIGLAIIMALFRNKSTAHVDEMNEMKG
ncbi:MAG: NADH-quinone oxidoreductase subunit NuoK [Candidatus Sulfobium sp.]|jgi:NADH-quinone oxidoreductase subunit K